MRRSLLVALVLAAAPAAAFVACSSSKGGPSQPGSDAGAGDDADESGVETPPAWDQPVTRPDDGTATSGRAACTYKRGDMPGATLGPSTPIDTQIPIENIVVVTMENHSFDSYLGHLDEYANRTDIESAAADAGNPAADGGTVPWHHADHLCTADTNHEWAGSHQEVDNGAMDGFVKVNQGWDAPSGGGSDPTLYDGARAMGYYDQTDLPYYYELASTFAIADNYHCSLQGPTYVNRDYLLAATSFGLTTNIFPDLTNYPFPTNDASVLDELEKRHTTWLAYAEGAPGAGTVYGPSGANRWGRHVTASFDQFLTDAKAGQLPQVSFVDPNLNSETTGGAGTDEHPPGDIQSGQLFVSQVVQAVTTSPQWAHLALFITHDENGGFYDHVPPPKACPPGDSPPALQPGDTTDAGFDAYGMRVILIVVSPYAKKAYVGHTVYDHTSITRFIEAKFKIPALSGRDANATPPTDLFDFTDPPAFATPPPLATPTIDPTGLSYCEATFPK
ncbi:MAG: phospholipase C [Polyangiaceae bacterium]